MRYTEDFRKKVMEYVDAFYPQAQVARMFHLSAKTVCNWVRQRRETGNLKPKQPIRGAIKLKTEPLLEYLREHPDAYLREIGDHFGCTNSAVYQRLKYLNIKRKKKTFLYKERDEEKRQAYLEKIKNIPPEKLHYVDESGIEEHLVREYARAPHNDRIYGEKFGKKFARQNVIAALNRKKIVAPMGYRCNCDAELVETWFETMLIPELSPGDVVVIDNAPFHNKTRLKKLVESANCRLIFLPPYSPDLNPIERVWNWMKNKIRETSHLHETLELATMAAVNAY
jgi:transposase